MATVTVERFLKAYPEFKDNCSKELIQQKLDHADLRVNDTIFGDGVDIRATMVYAAHLLAVSPNGERARLTKDRFDDIYLGEWRRMVRAATMGSGRVA